MDRHFTRELINTFQKCQALKMSSTPGRRHAVSVQYDSVGRVVGQKEDIHGNAGDNPALGAQ